MLVDIHAYEAHAAPLPLKSLKHLELRCVETERRPTEIIPAVRSLPCMCVVPHHQAKIMAKRAKRVLICRIEGFFYGDYKKFVYLKGIMI